MNAKILLTAIALSCAAASPAISQQTPPPSERTKQTEALVIEAAALVDKEGKSAFVEFRKKDSEWFHGSTYLFVYDLKGKRIAQSGLPEARRNERER